MTLMAPKKAVTIVGLLLLAVIVAYLGWGMHLVTSLPGSTYHTGKMFIHNCEHPRNKNAKMVCPMLFCKKELIESKLLTGQYNIISVEDRYFGVGKPYMLSGRIKYTQNHSEDIPSRFKCIMNGDSVTKLQLFTESDWALKSQAAKFWEI